MSETQQGQGIDRREAIRRVTAMLGGVALTGGGTLLTAVERAHARARAVRQVGTFTAQDIALLDEVADTILPETKTPGAKAAHTGAFMALMVTDTADLRNPNYHKASDTPDTLDYGFMGKVVTTVARAVTRMAG